MRIGIDCRCLEERLTGVGYYTFHLLNNIGKIDFINQYICFYNAFHRKPITLDFGFPNFFNLTTRFPNRILHRIWGTPFSRIIPIDLLIGKVDIFHSTNYLVPYQWHGKTIVTIYDLSSIKFPEFHPLGRRKDLNRRKIAWSIKRADLIIAISENTKRELIDSMGVLAEKIKVIYGAAEKDFKKIDDENLISRVQLKYNISKPFILYVGTIEPRKNLVRLIISFKELIDKRGFDYKLAIVGNKGWYYKDIFTAICNHNLKERVISLGYIPYQDLPALMNAAEVFVYPTLYEGFGLPVLEAMACGCPVVVSNSSSIPEVVREAGLYFDPYSIKDISEKIARVITNESLRRDLSKKGLERAKLFSWIKTAHQTLEAYKEVCFQA